MHQVLTIVLAPLLSRSDGFETFREPPEVISYATVPRQASNAGNVMKALPHAHERKSTTVMATYSVTPTPHPVD